MPCDWESVWYGPLNARQVALRLALAPLSGLYAIGSRAWHALWDFGLRRPVEIDGAYIVSVGALTVGGAGKTPVVMMLAQRALAAGHEVAVVTRGYGRASKQSMHFDSTNLPPVAQVGDEPLLIARTCVGAKIWVGADRVASARGAVAAGASVLILDDGFQARHLRRDVDVLVDGGVGNGWPLPAGPMRELESGRSKSALRWGRHARQGRVQSEAVAVSVRLPDGSHMEAKELFGMRVFALAAIARPRKFLGMLESLGAQVVGRAFFSDHHTFTAAQLDEVWEAANRLEATVISTEKDLQRIARSVHVLIMREVLISGGQLPDLLARLSTPRTLP